MNRLNLHLVLAGGLLAVSAPSSWAVEVFTLRSGNGPAGGYDTQLTYLAGPAEAEFGVPLVPAQFTAAQGGPPAGILPAVISVWIPSLPADPLAQWVNDTLDPYSGSTCLYAINFEVHASCVRSASLDFHFASDNWIGESWALVNEGLYLNGTALPGTIGGNYGAQTDLLGLNVSGLVLPGVNTLYILSSDVGGPSGLIFSGTVTVEGCDGTVGAQEQTASFELGAAYPNPFNPVTTLPFVMAETGQAELVVHNLTGQRVAILFQGLAERGTHEVSFDGAALPSGLYLYTLTTEQGSQTRKLVLSK
ncbi:MAG: T9SS type A sorting domain-containing protein [Candidatus Delongbacteria bacterium]